MQIKTFTSYQTKHIPLYQEILDLTTPVGKTYSGYLNWFHKTFLEGLKRKERFFTVAQEGKKLVGCILVKNTPDEKKICTLFVHPNFRKKGIGQKLIESALKKLGEYPLITVSEKNLPQLKPLLIKNGFHVSSAKKSIYQSKETEYFFNDKKADLIKDGLIPVLIQRMGKLQK